MLDVVSLFSGIEGFGLGLERTGGFRVVAQVEQDPFCLAVLEQHWPHVPRFTDVRTVGAHNLPGAHVVAGGFPCQDVSVVGRGAGIDGARSGLWSEMFRVIRELQPRWVIVENVAALLARGLDRVLGDLAAIGYDAEWDCIPASAVGAPHRRDRVWLVAYPGRAGRREDAGSAPRDEGADEGRAAEHDHEPSGDGQGDRAGAVADSQGNGRGQGLTHSGRRATGARQGQERGLRGRGARLGGCDWPVEPDVGRVAHGVPARVDRLRALGNAVVPQIPEWIGYRILEYEGGLNGN